MDQPSRLRVTTECHTDWAFELARELLAEELPQRWAHSLGAGAAATRLAPVLGRRLEVVRAAALLHDIGYASAITRTACHQLDGARYLRSRGVDERIVSLVAHHTFALLEAEERGLRDQLEMFALPPEDLRDVMVFCDMTSAADGRLISVPDRLAEIMLRHGEDSLVGRYMARAEPHIHASVNRIRTRQFEARHGA